MDSTDFLPTILEAAGKTVPDAARLDGRSFFPQLMGEPGTPREWVFCHYDPRPGWDKDKFTLERFARDRQFKLYDGGRLYHISRDLLEQRAIAPEYDWPESAAARKTLQAVLNEMPIPEQN